ncbi:MAG: hypothetical protein D3922_13880, partial [Candidatus Electrothrix sp. AR1]|nr:hypothetical protein [Candidatus Electrothrix sp. AR1]
MKEEPNITLKGCYPELIYIAPSEQDDLQCPAEFFLSHHMLFSSFPRATLDIDILIEPESLEKTKKVV